MIDEALLCDPTRVFEPCPARMPYKSVLNCAPHQCSLRGLEECPKGVSRAPHMFPQSATRMSHKSAKNVLQDCPEKCTKSDLEECPTRVFDMCAWQKDCPFRRVLHNSPVSNKSAAQTCPTRVSWKSVTQNPASGFRVLFPDRLWDASKNKHVC